MGREERNPRGHEVLMAKDPIAGQTVASREAAEKLAKLIGCSGAHETEDGWHPCRSQEDLMTLIRRGSAGLRESRRAERKQLLEGKAAKRTSYVDRAMKRRKNRRRVIARHQVRNGWEELGERGVAGIDRVSGGGLVSKKELPNYMGYGWPDSLRFS